VKTAAALVAAAALAAAGCGTSDPAPLETRWQSLPAAEQRQVCVDYLDSPWATVETWADQAGTDPKTTTEFLLGACTPGDHP
jgi:hypothetical protein